MVVFVAPFYQAASHTILENLRTKELAINKTSGTYPPSSTLILMGVLERPRKRHNDQYPFLASLPRGTLEFGRHLAACLLKALCYLFHRTSTQCDTPIRTLSWEPLLIVEQRQGWILVLILDAVKNYIDRRSEVRSNNLRLRSIR